MKIVKRGMIIRMTNVTNVHTCATRGVHLLMAIIPLPHGEFLEVSSDVVGGARVDVPVGVDAI
jgi:hypothetical protein